MRLRTFTARDMPTAMKMVRDALGEDAIILSSDAQKGAKNVTVIAAVDPSEGLSSPSPLEGPGRGGGHSVVTEKVRSPHPTSPSRGEELRSNNLIFEIQSLLRFHNIPEHFIAKIVHKASSKEFVSLSALHHISANRDEKPLLRHVLEKILNDHFRYEPLSFTAPHAHIMLVGTPGIGKTLTTAKLATKLSMEKRPFAVFTTDNQRAGGVEQLQAFTDILQMPLYVTPTPEELAHALESLPEGTQALIDTAGCNPYDAHEVKALKKLTQQKNVESIMVLPAGGDASETIDIVEAFADLSIKRLLITRADTARRFGSIIAAAAAHKLAFCHIGTSASIVNSLEPMSGGVLAQLLLRYQSNVSSPRLRGDRGG